MHLVIFRRLAARPMGLVAERPAIVASIGMDFLYPDGGSLKIRYFLAACGAVAVAVDGTSMSVQISNVWLFLNCWTATPGATSRTMIALPRTGREDGGFSGAAWESGRGWCFTLPPWTNPGITGGLILSLTCMRLRGAICRCRTGAIVKSPPPAASSPVWP